MGQPDPSLPPRLSYSAVWVGPQEDQLELAEELVEPPEAPASVRSASSSLRRTVQCVAVSTAATLLAAVALTAAIAPAARRSLETPPSSVSATSADSREFVSFLETGITACTAGKRGKCQCNCYWATGRGACKEDDGSCCHDCCCGEGGAAATATTQALVVDVDPDQKGGQFEEDVIKREPDRIQGCLCVFDVDRTLTGAQGQRDECPGNLVLPGVPDYAFSGGDLTLSSLGQGIQQTFCGRCYLGIVTMGSAGGVEEKRELRARLKGAGGLPEEWSRADSIVSPLVNMCTDSLKAKCVQGIIDWYMRQGVDLPAESVYFFDDKNIEVEEWELSGFNARQVSCATRDSSMDGTVGLCGATIDEIVRRQGTFTC